METETTTANAADRQPVVEFVRANRGAASLMLLVPGVLFLGLAIWLGYKGFPSGPPPETPDAATTDAAAPKLGSPNQAEYLFGFVLSLAAAMPLLVIGVTRLATAPAPSLAEDRTQSRIAILAAGGLFGLAIMLAGLIFFYLWNIRVDAAKTPSILAWLERGEVKEARWVLFPVLTLLIGAGLVFVSVQPARAEERNNPRLRRLVYGSNLILGAFLLLGLLIVGNVVLSLKLPNRLDTTGSGFYSLSPSTEQFLTRLDQPVTAYAFLPEGQGRVIDDARRLLLRCQEVSGGKFKVKFVNSNVDKEEVARLRAKYPQVELNRFGILLTFGEDESRHSFIRDDELIADEGNPRSGETKPTFTGESRLMRELTFLAEDKNKPIVYFSQSNGELQIGEANPTERTSPLQSARKLKEYLQKNNVEVRPLTFELNTAKVPDDASVVVVAQPQSPLSEDAVKAIRQFITVPKADGKKGRLVVLAGSKPGPEQKVVKTGLEALLEEFDIRLGDKFLYGQPTQQINQPGYMVAMVYPPAAEEGNPVAQAFADVVTAIPQAREVRPMQVNQQFKALPLLITEPGRYTWLEDTPPENPERTWLDLKESARLRQEKQASPNPRVLAVFTSEGTAGRVAVFGNSIFVTDAQVQGNTTPKMFELFGGTIDWLRERPAIAPGSAGKEYKYFVMPPTVDETRILWLPLGLALFTVIGIGAGVWVIRRK